MATIVSLSIQAITPIVKEATRIVARRMSPAVRLQMLRAGEALIVQCSSKIAESTACRHKQVDQVDDHAIHG